jgi:hypothetical protein
MPAAAIIKNELQKGLPFYSPPRKAKKAKKYGKSLKIAVN